MAESVYQSDPDAAPDSEFLPGELRHLVAGNRGRLLDLRRTPVLVTQVSPGTGFFEVEIGAFEDAGARWLVPVEDVASYQFAAGGRTAGRVVVDELRAAVARCDVQVTVTSGPAAQAVAHRRLRAERTRAAAWLASAGAPEHFDPLPHIEGATGWADAAGWLTGYLASRNLAGLEEAFSAGYVSNPWAGDLVLAHLTVLAELGLGTLSGRAIRDPDAFTGEWSRPRRAAHILARTGFAQELWARAGRPVTVYRGIGLPGDAGRDGKLAGQLPVISASLSRRVAESHFGSDRAAAGALYRQPLQPERVFMTFLETPAMNRQYAEAEAVLLPGDAPFF
ncbi:MAG TPA: hypothetical protein VIX86_20425 [Streptosporangiaceae bacterium]